MQFLSSCYKLVLVYIAYLQPTPHKGANIGINTVVAINWVRLDKYFFLFIYCIVVEKDTILSHLFTAGRPECDLLGDVIMVARIYNLIYLLSQITLIRPLLRKREDGLIVFDRFFIFSFRDQHLKVNITGVVGYRQAYITYM